MNRTRLELTLIRLEGQLKRDIARGEAKARARAEEPETADEAGKDMDALLLWCGGVAMVVVILALGAKWLGLL